MSINAIPVSVSNWTALSSNYTLDKNIKYYSLPITTKDGYKVVRQNMTNYSRDVALNKETLFHLPSASYLLNFLYDSGKPIILTGSYSKISIVLNNVKYYLTTVSKTDSTLIFDPNIDRAILFRIEQNQTGAITIWAQTNNLITFNSSTQQFQLSPVLPESQINRQLYDFISHGNNRFSLISKTNKRLWGVSVSGKEAYYLATNGYIDKDYNVVNDFVFTFDDYQFSYRPDGLIIDHTWVKYYSEINNKANNRNVSIKEKSTVAIQHLHDVPYNTQIESKQMKSNVANLKSIMTSNYDYDYDTPIEYAPIANDNSYCFTDLTTSFYVPANSSILLNDSGYYIFVKQILSQPLSGVLDIEIDGTFSYTPLRYDLSIEDQFIYQIEDVLGLTASATVFVCMPGHPINATEDNYCVNQVTPKPLIAREDNYCINPRDPIPLIATDDYYTFDEPAVSFQAGIVNSILKNDQGLDIYVYGNLTSPSYGNLTIETNGNFIYSPFIFGSEINDQFIYQIIDTLGNTASATVYINIPEKTIEAFDDSYTSDMTLQFNSPSSVLNNDTGDGITVTNIVETPLSGSLISWQSNGNFSYVPNQFTNSIVNDKFKYRITDVYGLTAEAYAYLSFQGSPIAASDDNITMYYLNTSMTVDQHHYYKSIIVNDSGTGVTVDTVLVSSQSGNLVSLNADGTFVYETTVLPSPQIFTDSFIYQIKDTFNQTATAQVNITRNPIQIVAIDDYYLSTNIVSCHESNESPLQNDYASYNLKFAGILSNPLSGTVQILDQETGTFDYCPFPSVSSQPLIDTFIYGVSDGFGNTASATITFEISASLLKAIDDCYSFNQMATSFNIPLINSITANDIGINIGVVTNLTNPQSGTLSGLSVNGTFNYVPYPSAYGLDIYDTFIYQISDSYSQLASATVCIEITGSPLIAVNDYYTIPSAVSSLSCFPPHALTSQPLTANDIGTQFYVVTNLTNPLSGFLSGLTIYGSFFYGATTVPPGPGGDINDSFIYQIKDYFGQTASATVFITRQEGTSLISAVSDCYYFKVVES